MVLLINAVFSFSVGSSISVNGVTGEDQLVVIAVGEGVQVASGVQVGTAEGATVDAAATAASTVAWMSGVGTDVGVGSAVQAANRAMRGGSGKLNSRDKWIPCSNRA